MSEENFHLLSTRLEDQTSSDSFIQVVDRESYESCCIDVFDYLSVKVDFTITSQSNRFVAISQNSVEMVLLQAESNEERPTYNV